MAGIIKTEGISKYFGTTPASDNISILINQGEIYGFIGLNGAGKTTFIRMLLGMIKPNKGRAALFGKEVNSSFDQWNDVGYLVETPNSYPNLTVLENLKVYYQLRKLNDASLLDRIELITYDFVGKPCSVVSSDLASALRKMEQQLKEY